MDAAFWVKGGGGISLTSHCINNNSLSCLLLSRKIENDLKYYQAQNRKWKIENINPFTSKQTNSSNEMEAHVIALIVTGAIIGLVLIFALSLFIRLRRMYVA